jgi:hypothetical protein
VVAEAVRGKHRVTTAHPTRQEVAVGIPIDDQALPPTDEEPVEPDPAPATLPADPEAPPHDAADQAREVLPGWRLGRVTRDSEVNEADAIDQALEVPLADTIDE